jgi:tetratricopeptide (TPR) repeat protein
LLSKIQGKSFQLAQLSYLLSSNLMKFKRFHDSLKYNELAIKISEEVDEKHPVVALFYRDKALINKFLGHQDKAILYSLKDIEILEKHAGKYDDLLPDSYFSLSKTYEQQKNYEKAVEYNLKAIQFETKRKKKRSLNLSGLYHNLAYYYVKLNNLKMPVSL